MLNLNTHITINDEVMRATNLVDRFDDDDLSAIGGYVYDGYQRDKQSREKWEERTQAAMDLAMQTTSARTFPWPNASNVAFPLITIATMQFHSRAFPALVQAPDIVQYRLVGADADGSQTQRARRIGRHMSWQVMEGDRAWSEQHDRLLIIVPIVGCAFVKTYYSVAKNNNVSELVTAFDLTMDYYAKSVEDAARKTHRIPMHRNDMHSLMVTGVFRDCREEAWYKGTPAEQMSRTQARADRRTGQRPAGADDDKPFTTLEQHCWLDLDGDGYSEPYVVTIDEQSRNVLRIVTRFDREADIERLVDGTIIRITPMEYFTKYGFIPSPDGGVYDTGYGALLGPLNNSVNSIVNQLIDAGTIANTAGGFLGRGVKIRGGNYTFSPMEWKPVDSTGDDLKKSVFPLPVREPSKVSLDLLNLLIQYTNRVSGSTDTMMGENPGQNTPAQTTQTMVEQGAKIYSAIYKRIWGAMREEFRKLYVLNAIYLPEHIAYGADDAEALRSDYNGDPSLIAPVSNPIINSEADRMQRATALKQAAGTTPGYDKGAVEREYLAALHVDGVDAIYPGVDKFPPPPNPKMEIEKAKIGVKQAELEVKKNALQIQMQTFMLDLQEQARVNDATILDLRAKAALALEQAGGIKVGHEIAAFEAMIGALKSHNEAITNRVKVLAGAQQDQSGRMGQLEAEPGDQGVSQESSAG
jgi:chaperonin GroES